jgi:hypothetical protein
MRCNIKEVEDWKLLHRKEEERASSLRAHLSRTERELYQVLQKKHQIMRGTGGSAAVVSNGPAPIAAPLPVTSMFNESGDVLEVKLLSISKNLKHLDDNIC